MKYDILPANVLLSLLVLEHFLFQGSNNMSTWKMSGYPGSLLLEALQEESSNK